MINSRATLYLLAFPVGLMGVVQLAFATLSWVVFNDQQEVEFLVPAVGLLSTASLLLAMAKRFDVTKIGFRDSLIFAVFTWIVVGFIGAIPIMLITQVTFTDAIFESVSGITTTGATVLTGLDHLPKSFLLYRQFLQWMGGMGVVIFVVAILPMLNVGGMKLLKAETPGPIKDDKLSPRIANTAHYLWLVYLAITLLCAVSYYLAGMSLYDAIAHSFTTVATGGFSTHDASLGYFKSPIIMMVANVFMLLGAISFALHFRFLQTRGIRTYWRDEETRIFLIIVLLLSLLVSLLLYFSGDHHSFWTVLSDALFHVVSFITSTGFGAAGYTEWPNSVIFILFIAGYLGGCAGSTAGGNKIIRSILCARLMSVEMKRLIHPKGVFVVKYRGRPVEASILSATVAFMSFVAFSSMVLTLMLMATGLDFWSALSGVAACLNVLGPGFGELGSNFIPVSDTGTWILSGAMILGRLEYFTVLALFLPGFWRK